MKDSVLNSSKRRIPIRSNAGIGQAITPLLYAPSFGVRELNERNANQDLSVGSKT